MEKKAGHASDILQTVCEKFSKSFDTTAKSV